MDVYFVEGSAETISDDEVVESWAARVTKKLHEQLVADCDNLTFMSKDYLRVLEPRLRNSSTNNNTVLTRNVFKHVRTFYLCYKTIRIYSGLICFWKHMESVLVILCNLELGIATQIKTHDSTLYNKVLNKISSKVIYILTVFSLHDNQRICHILLKLEHRCNNRPWRDVMQQIIRYFLLNTHMTNKSEEAFCRNYLVYLTFQYTLKPKSLEVYESVLHNSFGVTPRTLTNKNLRSILSGIYHSLQDVVLASSKSCEPAIRSYFKFMDGKQMDEDICIQFMSLESDSDDDGVEVIPRALLERIRQVKTELEGCRSLRDEDVVTVDDDSDVEIISDPTDIAEICRSTKLKPFKPGAPTFLDSVRSPGKNNTVDAVIPSPVTEEAQPPLTFLDSVRSRGENNTVDAIIPSTVTGEAQPPPPPTRCNGQIINTRNTISENTKVGIVQEVNSAGLILNAKEINRIDNTSTNVEIAQEVDALIEGVTGITGISVDSSTKEADGVTGFVTTSLETTSNMVTCPDVNSSSKEVDGATESLEATTTMEVCPEVSETVTGIGNTSMEGTENVEGALEVNSITKEVEGVTDIANTSMDTSTNVDIAQEVNSSTEEVNDLIEGVADVGNTSMESTAIFEAAPEVNSSSKEADVVMDVGKSALETTTNTEVGQEVNSDSCISSTNKELTPITITGNVEAVNEATAVNPASAPSNEETDITNTVLEDTTPFNISSATDDFSSNLLLQHKVASVSVHPIVCDSSAKNLESDAFSSNLIKDKEPQASVDSCEQIDSDSLDIESNLCVSIRTSSKINEISNETGDFFSGIITPPISDRTSDDAASDHARDSTKNVYAPNIIDIGITQYHQYDSSYYETEFNNFEAAQNAAPNGSCTNLEESVDELQENEMDCNVISPLDLPEINDESDFFTSTEPLHPDIVAPKDDVGADCYRSTPNHQNSPETYSTQLKDKLAIANLQMQLIANQLKNKHGRPLDARSGTPDQAVNGFKINGLTATPKKRSSNKKKYRLADKYFNVTKYNGESKTKSQSSERKPEKIIYTSRERVSAPIAMFSKYELGSKELVEQTLSGPIEPLCPVTNADFDHCNSNDSVHSCRYASPVHEPSVPSPVSPPYEHIQAQDYQNHMMSVNYNSLIDNLNNDEGSKSQTSSESTSNKLKIKVSRKRKLERPVLTPSKKVNFGPTEVRLIPPNYYNDDVNGDMYDSPPNKVPTSPVDLKLIEDEVLVEAAESMKEYKIGIDDVKLIYLQPQIPVKLESMSELHEKEHKLKMRGLLHNSDKLNVANGTCIRVDYKKMSEQSPMIHSSPEFGHPISNLINQQTERSRLESSPYIPRIKYAAGFRYNYETAANNNTTMSRKYQSDVLHRAKAVSNAMHHSTVGGIPKKPRGRPRRALDPF